MLFQNFIENFIHLKFLKCHKPVIRHFQTRQWILDHCIQPMYNTVFILIKVPEHLRVYVYVKIWENDPWQVDPSESQVYLFSHQIKMGLNCLRPSLTGERATGEFWIQHLNMIHASHLFNSTNVDWSADCRRKSNWLCCWPPYRFIKVNLLLKSE